MELSQESRRPIVNRLRRAQGQLTGVIRILEEGGDCELVLTQLAAVGKALDRAGFQLVSRSLKQCLTDSENGEIDSERLERVFLSLA
jgi:DNA-binding FrmR family transcriptional regulator